MKKLSIVILATLSGLALRAQKIAEAKVSTAARTALSTRFPGAVGKWETENGNYEVNFKLNEKSMSVLMTKKGEVLETETDMSVHALTQNILTYIKEHYKGAKIAEAAKIEKANGDINYEAEVNGRDLLFTTDGVFIKATKA